MQTIQDVIDSSIQSASFHRFLEHFGIKGMRWGVRRKRGPDGTVGSLQAPGSRPEPHTDFKTALELRSRAQAGGSKALSNNELNALMTRINLEKKFAEINKKPSKFDMIKKNEAKVKILLSAYNTIGEVKALRTSKKAAKAVIT